MSSVKNYIGSYASLAAVWSAHPEGGRENDVCYISGSIYEWNKYHNQWELQSGSGGGGGDIDMSGYARFNEGTGRLDYSMLPHQVLVSMGSTLDGTPVSLAGRSKVYHYDPTTRKIYYIKANGTPYSSPFTPDRGVVYCNAVTGKLYRWDPEASGGQGDMVDVGNTPQGGETPTPVVPAEGAATLLEGSGMLNPAQWPRMIIANVSATSYDDVIIGTGSIVFDVANDRLLLLGGVAGIGDDDYEGFEFIDLGEPVKNVVYYCASDKKFYQWNGSSFAALGDFYTKAEIDAKGFLTAHQDISGKADWNEHDHRLSYATMAPVVLNSITRAASDDIQAIPAGPDYYPDEGVIKRRVNVPVGDFLSAPSQVEEYPSAGCIYYCKADSKFYRWGGSTDTGMVEIAAGGGGSSTPAGVQEVTLDSSRGTLSAAQAAAEVHSSDYFQWLLEEPVTEGGVTYTVRKMIWHLPKEANDGTENGLFIDALGSVIS